ncbi:MspA family porin [Nocardia alni]|uniref:MspA family porin n=1 Tax=Nocardia alni TaxID=2815723 RepID=UPI001C22B076|nr:MspA family porin [Nocardia alni]
MTNIRKGTLARVVGVGVAATAAFGYFSVGGANADVYVPLPPSSINEVMGDGTNAHVDISGESANINPGMVASPLSRNVWTTGHAQVNLAGGEANNSKTSTHLTVGYIVACQVDLSGGMTPEAAGGVTVTPGTSSTATSYSGTGTLGTTLTLGAGQAKELNILDSEVPDDFGTDTHHPWQGVTGPHQSMTWHDEEFNVDGCGGYAQARSFATAAVYTPHGTGYVTAYGKPFSIG